MYCPPEFRQKKTAEQMENSSPNPSFSICDIQIQKQMSRSFGKSFPQKIVLLCLVRTAFRPATLPEYLEGRTPKEKHPFLFQKKFHPPRQTRNARSVFSFGVAAESARRWWGFRGAYDLGQSHHALRACLIQGSAGNESELFGIMTTIPNLKKD